MNKEQIFIKFTRGEIDEDTPYAEGLRALHEDFVRQMNAGGGGCPACKRRRLTREFRDGVAVLLAEHEA